MSARANPRGRVVAWPALLGDAVVFLLVSLYGFSTHGLIGRAPFERFLATFLPFTAAYLLMALGLRAHTLRNAGSLPQLWRPALAAVLAAPLGAVGRGLWLGSAPIPVFIGVMAGMSLAFLLGWRLAYALAARRL
jgi:hypothetical protein